MTCPVCHFPMNGSGVGLLRRDILPGDYRFGTEGEPGEDVHYVRCRHTPEAVRRAYFKSSGLLESDAGQSLWPMAGREEALRALEHLAGSAGGMLALHGGFGTGKSFMLKWLVDRCISRQRKAVYVPMAELLDTLRSTFQDGAAETFSKAFENVQTASVLAIDELDKWAGTDWAQDKVFQLLDWRYRRSDKLLTAVAYNEPASVPPYILSRLFEHCVVDLGSKDLRPAVGEEEMAF